MEHDYENDDGPKTTKIFKQLPASETIAKVIPNNAGKTLSGLNSLYTWFGQFVAYDMAFTAKSDAKCLCGDAATKKDQNCFNIDADGLGCKSFPRSEDVRDTFGCSFKHREQFSKVTHWLDMDTMYGSNYKQSELVRTYDKGKLKWSVVSQICTV